VEAHDSLMEELHRVEENHRRLVEEAHGIERQFDVLWLETVLEHQEEVQPAEPTEGDSGE